MQKDREEQLVTSAMKTVLGYARNLTRDRALAEDLSQVGLIQIVRRCRRWREEPNNPTAWAVRVAVNAMLSVFTRVVQLANDHEILCDLAVLSERLPTRQNQRAEASAKELVDLVRGRLRPRTQQLFDQLVEQRDGHLNAQPVVSARLCSSMGLGKATVSRMRAEIRQAASEVMTA